MGPTDARAHNAHRTGGRVLRSLAAAVILSLMLVVLVAPRAAEAMDIQTVTTPGGLTAWLVEDDTVPIVAVNFAFEGGDSQNPDGKEGLANLLSATLDEGAGDLDSQAFQARLQDLSVRLSFSSGRDNFYGLAAHAVANHGRGLRDAATGHQRASLRRGGRGPHEEPDRGGAAERGDRPGRHRPGAASPNSPIPTTPMASRLTEPWRRSPP